MMIGNPEERDGRSVGKGYELTMSSSAVVPEMEGKETWTIPVNVTFRNALEVRIYTTWYARRQQGDTAQQS
jgi:hypothetical protein